MQTNLSIQLTKFLARWRKNEAEYARLGYSNSVCSHLRVPHIRALHAFLIVHACFVFLCANVQVARARGFQSDPLVANFYPEKEKRREGSAMTSSRIS